MIQERLEREGQLATEKPLWHQDLALALQKIQPRANDESSALQRSTLMRAVKENPRDVHVWREFLTYVNKQRALAVSSDPDTTSTLRNAAILLHTTATNVIQMSSTNRFSLAYLSIWIDLAMLQDESADDEYLARDVFKQLKYNRIGTTLPEFWNAYAEFEERHGDSDKAAKLRAKGVSCATKAISTDSVHSSLSRQPRTRYGMDTTPQVEKENKQSPELKPASHPRVRPYHRSAIPSRAARAPLSKDTSPEANRGGLIPETPEQPELFPPGSSSPLLRAMASAPDTKLPRTVHDSATHRYLQAQRHPVGSPHLSLTRSHLNRASPSPRPLVSAQPGSRLGLLPRSGQNSHLRDPNMPARPTSGYSDTGDRQTPTASGGPARARVDRVDSILSREEVSSSGGKTPSPELRYADNRPQKRVASNTRDTAKLDMRSEALSSSSSSQRLGHQSNCSPVADFGSRLPISRRTDSIAERSSSRDQKYEDGTEIRPRIPAFVLEMCQEVAVVNGVEYIVMGMIGKGGSSRVFRVLGPSRTIMALKRVQVRRSCPNFKSTFDSYANEIDLLQRLRGAPNIVYCYDAEIREDLGTIYLLMEYGDIDLAKWLMGSGKKSPKTIDEISYRNHWMQMLEAVQTIHEAKIVHGDLKPANFLIVAGKLKLIDFGIAKAIPTEDTTKIFRDAQVGTPNYMSPEALISYDGEDESSGEMRDVSNGGRSNTRPKYRIGRASDIWSLGCILYQMVYGKTPFAHLTNIMKKLSCIQDENYDILYPPVKDITILSVLKGCLQRDPNKRMSIPELLSHDFLRGGEQGMGTASIAGMDGRSWVRGVMRVLERRGAFVNDGTRMVPIRSDAMTDGVMDEVVDDMSHEAGETPARSEQRLGHIGKFRQTGLTPTTSGITHGTRTGGYSFSYGNASLRGASSRSGERHQQ